MRSFAACTCIAAVAALAGIANATPPVFHVTDLGGIGTPNSTIAYAINDYGQIVGKTNAEGTAFLWQPTIANGITGTMVPLPAEQAYDINSYGQVVGITSGFSAFLWTPNSPNGTTGSAVLLGTSVNARAYAINSYGQVVLTATVVPGSGSSEPAIWTPSTPNGQTGSLTTMAMTRGSYYFGINGRGQVTSGTFIWTPDSDNTMTGSVIDLRSSNAAYSTGFGINSSGNVIGNSASFQGDGALWKALDDSGDNYTLVNIGRLENTRSALRGINNHDAVVGYGAPGINANEYMAFLWTEADGMLDLNTLLDASGANWTLNSAEDVNNLGQIVGYGLYDPDGAGPDTPVTRSFLLTPIPEPGLMGLMAAVMSVVVSFRTPRMRGR